MLEMQRDFRCYRSARLEAAVEAMDSGACFEDVPIRESLLFSSSFDHQKICIIRPKI
jgi:hypothetical protein